MKKSIIISIQPQWVEKILNGEKTIEIRKSIPKCELPIDVYIYCSKSGDNLYKVIKEHYELFSGAVAEPFDSRIGLELTKEKLYKKYRENTDNGFSDVFTNLLNGKIVAKFTLNTVEEIFYKKFPNGVGYYHIFTCDSILCVEKNSRLNEFDLLSYLKPKEKDCMCGYAWHIDNLEIFDKPMELNQFYKGNYEQIIDHLQIVGCDSCYCPHLTDNGCDIMYCPSLKIKKAFQSWGYAYKEE